MSNQREVALAYLERFCSGDIDGLVDLLHPALRCRGPFLRCEKRDAYLDALRKDPPEPAGYRIIEITESDASVSIYYDYQKANGSVTIAQLFRFEDGKIMETLLVFDSKDVV